MNTEDFAARRAPVLDRSDKDLRPLVEEALIKYANGEANWEDELVIGASVIWSEVFEDEAPNDNPERMLSAYQKSIRDSLAKTDQPDVPPTDGEIDRVTKWLSTYTVNDATFRAADARGAKFKRWVTRRDASVRDTHRLADGQIAPINGTFDVGGYSLRFPGDPVGPPELWINCRCLLQSAARIGENAMTATTFAMTDVGEDTQPMPEIDEDEELPPDELDDGEDEVTEIPVHGVLAPEGVPTGDGRQFALGALTSRDLPIPLRYETVSTHGGNTSDVVTVGRIDEVFREGNELRFRGMLVLTKEHSASVVEGIIDGTVRGVSIDADDLEVDMESLSEEVDGLDGRAPLTVFTHARVAGLTIVPIPAFQEAFIGLGHQFADEMTPEELAACAACAEGGDDEDDNPDIELGYDFFKDYSPEQRQKMADSGEALPDGSFPIADCSDLANAIQSVGRAGDRDAAIAHIKKRANALDCGVELPEDWSSMNSDRMIEHLMAAGTVSFAPGTHDGPGWITHPIPTSRIRRYWTHGKGAAKIRWGVAGDFKRCERQLRKYIANPKWLAGACANMHHEALGIWPGMEGGKRKRGLIASGEPAPIVRMVAAATRVFDSWMFERPDVLDGTQGVEVVGEHTFGYIAVWGVCHIGVDKVCTSAPYSNTNYGFFATGVVDTDAGPVHVGQITMDTGHAGLKSNARVAASHYDNTGAAVADVAVGEDEYGIWFSGALRSNITEDQLHALRASGRLSGDWRGINGNLELVAALAVNVPGFPVPALAASAEHGEQLALVAAGIPPVTAAASPTPLDAEMAAGIARVAVAEYIHAMRREQRADSLRTNVREKRLGLLRAQMKEN